MSKDKSVSHLWPRISILLLSLIAGSTCREAQGFVSGGMKILQKQKTTVDAHQTSAPKEIQGDTIPHSSPLFVDIHPLQDSKDIWRFLTIAAHETDLEAVKSNPDLARYANNYNFSTDIGFVANEAALEYGNGEVVGAAWVRCWSDSDRGYGYIRDDIPELAIAVEHNITGRGIGSKLLKAVIDEVSSRKKIPAICLSCRDDNPALRLYERLGFRKVSGTEVTNRAGSQSFTMVLWLPQVRNAAPADLPLIVNFVQKKATFDQNMGAFQGTTSMTEQSLKESLFDGPIAHANVLLVEIDSRPIGIALYYFRFSSFAGRPSLWLDDLYIDEEFRSLGAGKRLIDELIVIAHEQKCTHIGWTADDQNEKGLAFYHRLGATITQTNGRSHMLRLGIEQ